MAYNTKLYKSTGSGWDEVRVASEWGLIANKPSTFTPTAHSHSEYLSLAGGTLSGSLSITSANFPVLDITRNTGSSGSGVYGGARLRRVTSNPQAGVGIGFYFSAPNASGAEKFAGLFGACLTNIASGAEVGQLKFTPAWQGNDPYDKTVMTLTATGLNQGHLALNGDIFVSNGADIGGDVAVARSLEVYDGITSNTYISAVGKIYSAPTTGSDSDNTVATKGYVDSKSSLHRVVTITSGITIDDNYKHNDLIICNNSSEIQINTKSSTNHPIGTRIDFYRRGFGRVKFYPQSGSIIAKSAPYYIKERYMAASLIKISQTEWLLIGALSTS